MIERSQLFTHLTFLSEVFIPELLWSENPDGTIVDGAAYVKFKEAWAGEAEMLQYLTVHHLYNKCEMAPRVGPTRGAKGHERARAPQQGAQGG